MYVPIPVPIGERIVVSVQGRAWKFVTCENCQQEYAYVLQLEAIGQDLNVLFLDEADTEKRARAQAEQNLLKQSENMIRPVPCPQCGHYQADMVALLKEESPSNLVFTAGLAVAALSFIPLAFDIPNIWIATAAGVSVGVLLMAYPEFAAYRFNPNDGDPEPRKARGRKHSLWGDQLQKLLATPENNDTSEPEQPAE
ncbi:hypothetical protein [Blastopirellula marina]|uniref:Uncharacterized protein n=1 Tax=Blastopirellula marina TaxID=124 RepID=A0A2S8GN16_9BACT|nr:hypothetical protein [Blastopirellula marina]PQO45833.1 hypothetical protein C5Y93_11280 [Blastopirellula marina]